MLSALTQRNERCRRLARNTQTTRITAPQEQEATLVHILSTNDNKQHDPEQFNGNLDESADLNTKGAGNESLSVGVGLSDDEYMRMLRDGEVPYLYSADDS